jgi:hypothetical protein
MPAESSQMTAMANPSIGNFNGKKNICNWRIFETCLIQRVLLSNQQPAAFFVAKLLQRRMNIQ